VKVAAEPVLADPHVGVVAGRLPAFGRVGEQLLVAAAVREVEVDPDRRRERIVGRGEALVHEDNDEARTVVEARIEIPPLVRASPVVGTCAVLPRRHGAALQAETRVVGVLRRDDGERRWVYVPKRDHGVTLSAVV
jgi:hypothetical protein